jgi:hypothetical protein
MIGVRPEMRKKRSKDSLYTSPRFLNLTRKITLEEKNKILSDATTAITPDTSIKFY